MNRHSVNTTKSGKFMNPTDQARKEAHKKELKKNKKNRQLIRTAILKGKDPSQIIEEMEKLDQMEYNVVQPSPLNENVLDDKRKKLRDTLDRILEMHAKNDQEKWTELKEQLIRYKQRRADLISNFKAVMQAQQVRVNEIPLPSVTNNTTRPLLPSMPLLDDAPYLPPIWRPTPTPTPMHLRMPPPPPPPRSAMGLLPGQLPGLPQVPRPGPPSMPFAPPLQPHTGRVASSRYKTPNVVSAKLQIARKDKFSTTIEAKPHIRNLLAESTIFLPSSLNVKRDNRPKPYSISKHRAAGASERQSVGATQTKSKDDAYKQFMQDMEGLL